MVLPIYPALLAGGACYVAQKGISYLCSRPSDARVSSLFDQFRRFCTHVQSELAQAMGPAAWTFMSRVVFDNMWISAFVVTFLVLNFQLPCTILIVADVCVSALVISMLSWLARFYASQYLPGIGESLGNLIDPWENVSDRARTEYARLAQRLFGNVGSQVDPTDPRLNIAALPDIPQELWQDSLFRYIRCGHTGRPIRDPVYFSGGVQVYERRYAEQHVANQFGLAPDNDLPYFPDSRLDAELPFNSQLQPRVLHSKEGLRAAITSCMEYHERILREFVRKNYICIDYRSNRL